MAVDPAAFKAVMGQWPSGVTVVTTRDAEGPAGMTASSFSSVSLSPPLVSVCVARHLAIHDRLRAAGHFAVNILSKDAIDHGKRFAGLLPGVTDRFAGIETHTAETGAPLLAGILGWVDCRLWAAYDGGDHSIFVGEVLAAGVEPTASPLLYHSRAWGQFADVLAQEVRLVRAGLEAGARVIERAFGEAPEQPATVEALVSRVRAALAATPGDHGLVVLDDAASAADPLLLRLALQALGQIIGRRGVGLRLGAGPMALANAVVALKSGVQQLSISPDEHGPYAAERDVRRLLERMGVRIAAT